MFLNDNKKDSKIKKKHLIKKMSTAEITTNLFLFAFLIAILVLVVIIYIKVQINSEYEDEDEAEIEVEATIPTNKLNMQIPSSPFDRIPKTSQTPFEMY